jgi:two-component system, NarL family, capsular synthesis sensor histidine kinase RcsC
MVSVRRARILVVDDEDFVRSLIIDVLANLGHQVDAASDGAEAIRRCEQTQYDLVVSDLRMPKEDGAALYQALRDKYGPGMPRMIFVTGQAHSLDYAGFLGIAGVPVLAKPFTVDALQKAVSQTLSTEGPTRG